MVREGGKQEYETVQKLFNETTANDIRERLLTAMCKVQTSELVSNLLDFSFSDKVATQDIHYGTAALAANAAARHVQWEYVKTNWDMIVKKIGGNLQVFDRYIQYVIGRFSSLEAERDITEFFKDKNTAGYDRGIVQKLDVIKGNAKYKERDADLVLEWLKTNGYA